MQNTLKYLTVALLTLFSLPAAAQHLTKLEIGRKDTYVVETNALTVDTLILHDKATLRFRAWETSTLHARFAYIGDACTITAAGANGKAGRAKQDGENGADGGDLKLQMHLMQLGSLTLDTRGGDGGNGYNGKNGAKPRRHTIVDVGKDGQFTKSFMEPGTAGQKGSAPGLGGSGGDLDFSYTTNGFTPIFNHEEAPQSIQVLYKAGKEGKAGRDGISYANSASPRENHSATRGMAQTAAGKVCTDGTVHIQKEDTEAISIQ